ncbi:MAG: hypothetical protein RMM58_05875 [Chloroflexota bacterium]|nr:hypothetical protein [Dehalococcoidia bacterium]MDW8253389.1 hypothetical protein [Chloroflexota bacterium]
MVEMGLLWYEPNRMVPLADRIDAAAARYLERFGVAPNVCLVAASELEPFSRITLRGDKRIQPGYLLIGVEHEEALPPWQPERRSSDEAEIALLAPDGRVLQRLRPLRAPAHVGSPSDPAQRRLRRRQPAAQADAPAQRRKVSARPGRSQQ